MGYALSQNAIKGTVKDLEVAIDIQSTFVGYTLIFLVKSGNEWKGIAETKGSTNPLQGPQFLNAVLAKGDSVKWLEAALIELSGYIKNWYSIVFGGPVTGPETYARPETGEEAYEQIKSLLSLYKFSEETLSAVKK